VIVSERCRVYEQKTVWSVTGPAIRPGGLELTRVILNRCNLPIGATILDVGCGTGATVEYLFTELGFRAIGIDPSSMLLKTGKTQNGMLKLIQSPGEQLPFAASQFHAVLAECSLSLIENPALALAEFSRVLRPNGILVLTDIYARNSAAVPILRQLPLACCLSGAMSQVELMTLLEVAGFNVLTWADHTAALAYFTGQLIFVHGSLANFWNCTTAGHADSDTIQQSIRLAQPGYYALNAVKKE